MLTGLAKQGVVKMLMVIRSFPAVQCVQSVAEGGALPPILCGPGHHLSGLQH